MRLPLEIRYRIYGFLLEPLSGSYYGDLPEMMGGNGVRFRVSDAHSSCSSHDPDFTHPILEPNGHVPEGMEDLFELYKAIREGTADDAQVQRGEQLRLTAQFEVNPEIDEITAVSTSDGDDDDDDTDDCGCEMKTEEHANILMKMNDAPPHVRDSFGACHSVHGLQVYQGPDTVACENLSDNLQLSPCNKHLNGKCRNVNLYFLRPLFYVSHQFTREIGACLWKNAIIKFETPECFFSFIAPRPAILNFLKCIELELQFYDDWFDTSSDTVVAICQFISEYMDLRYIRIHLVTETAYLEKIMAGGKLEKWKIAFNELKVWHGFDLRVVDIPIYSRFQIPNVRSSTFHPLEQKLKELWHPKVLRKRELTEV